MWGASQFLARALESPPVPGAVHALWAIPLGFALAVSTYDQPVVASLGPALVTFSGLICLMFTLKPPLSFDDLGSLSWPLLRHWSQGWGRVTQAYESAGLRIPACGYAPLLKGLLLAAPLLLVFTALFCSADPEFGAWLDSMASQISLDGALPSLRWAGYAVATWALLLGLAFATRCPRGPEEPARGDAGPWVVALALVNLLFAGFLALQLQHVLTRVADPYRLYHYAREGFLQLLLTTVLVYRLVRFLYGRCLVGRTAPVLRSLTCLFVTQAIGVGLSALHRLWVYSQEFGMSILRIYAVLGVLAFCLLLVILLGALLLEPGRARLQALLNVTGAIVLVLTSWVDVHGWVVSSNLSLARERGRAIDVRYLQHLSNDALPALLEGARDPDPRVSADCQRIIARLPGPVRASWPSFNLSRLRAGTPPE